MESPGVIGMVQMLAILVFAAPMAIYGSQLLLNGRSLLGGGLVVVAIGMLVAERYLTNPMDPADLTERTFSWIRRRGD